MTGCGDGRSTTSPVGDEDAPRSGTKVERPPGSVGFVGLPNRWVVERTSAWIGRCRRNSHDYELYRHSSEAIIISCSDARNSIGPGGPPPSRTVKSSEPL